MRQHRYQKAVKHPARIPPPPERRVPSTSHRRVVPPCGRDVPPQAPGSGEASPHTPPPTAEPASPLRSDPPKGRLHCAAMLSLCSVRTLPIGRLHCAPLTVCTGSRGRLLPAILLRRCLPSRNTCKLYVDNANMVIDQLSLSTGLPCAGLLCRTRRQRFRTGGPGPMQESHARFARTLRALHAANARRLARGRPGALSQCLHAQQPRLLGYR